MTQTKTEIFLSLKENWAHLRKYQATITKLQTELQALDPKAELTSWDNGQFATTSTEVIVESEEQKEIENFGRKFFNAKKVLEQLAKAEYKEYSVPASIGQAVGIYFADKQQ